MKIRTLAAAGAAVSLAIAPAVAADRAATPVEGESEIGGGGASGVVLGVLAAAAIIAAIIIAVDDDDDPISV